MNAIDEFHRPLFAKLAYTGARPNELLALRWSDIDFVPGEIIIRKGLVRGFEGLPKSTSAERKIPIVHRVELALELLKGKNTKGIDGHVFTRKDGQPIKKHLDRIWKRALSRCEFCHRPSYQLRHPSVLVEWKGFRIRSYLAWTPHVRNHVLALCRLDRGSLKTTGRYVL